uniref:Band_3_cyto domain-containing protein n=1 Tax=Heterorhabditis bacteriophora TaxID=37862 RepID=A0A1I7X7I3_HETBA
MPGRSLSIAGVPDFRGSQTSLRRRKTSVTEPIRTPTVAAGITENDLLLNPITLSQVVHLGNHAESPVENVRRLVLAHPEEDPPIYSELLKLEIEDGQHTWKQVSRKLFYPLQALSLLYFLILAVRLLYLDAIVNSWLDRGCLSAQIADNVRDCLAAPKHHLGCVPGQNHFDKRDNHISLVRNQKGHIKYVDSESEEEDKIVKLDLREKRRPLKDVIKANHRLIHRIAPSTEAAAILTGQIDELDKPLAAFVRLRLAQDLYPLVPDLPIPTRFIFVLLSPADNYENERINIGRTVGSLMVDEETRTVGMLYATYDNVFDDDTRDAREHGTAIVRTGRLFGGLIQDIK